VFTFEIIAESRAGSSLERSLVTDWQHFTAVKEKIKIIKKLLSRPTKAAQDPNFRLLMPYAIPSLETYRKSLQSYEQWKSDNPVLPDGKIFYPTIKCSTLPRG